VPGKACGTPSRTGHSGRACRVATLAREMGHASTERTFAVYGGWCHEMGADAAALRAAWAAREPEEAAGRDV